MSKAPRISLYFYKLSDFVAFCQGKHSASGKVKNPEVIYLPALPLIVSLSDKSSEITTFIDKTRQNNTKIIIALPYIMRGKAAEAFKKNYENLAKFSDGFLLGNIGDSEIIKELSEKTGLPIWLHTAEASVAEGLSGLDVLPMKLQRKIFDLPD